MTTLPLWIATGLYLWQAWNFGGGAMSLVFVGYSVANIGLIIAARP